MNKSVERDAEGGIKVKGYSVKATFKGNVSFSSCEKIQQEYGLEYKIDIAVTTDCKEVKKDNLLSYNQELYEVKGVYPRDSHLLLVGEKWRK